MMIGRGRRLMKWLGAAIMLTMISPCVWSACSVNTQGVNFGNYDPFGNRDSDSAGNIAVTCDVGTAYSLSFSTGSGTYADRVMTSGIYVLDYNLYVNPARAIVWGDGTGATTIVGGMGTATMANVAVYGRIPARQNAHVGNYSDEIVVTVNF